MPLLFVASLLAGTVPAATNTPAAKPAKGSPDEVVCKRETITGSLAGTKRTCMTRADWQAQAEAAQNEAERHEDRSRLNACTTPGGC